MLTGFLITLGVLIAVALAPVLIPLVWLTLYGIFCFVVLMVGIAVSIVVAPFKWIYKSINK
ncbi:hypothetical protein BMBphi_gp040 [Bacillus phage vB_BthS_BMBphi]|nr:hypothetical protein BMBphi_gp040 [Bacillus phage vB_BthS_BMBphi]